MKRDGLTGRRDNGFGVAAGVPVRDRRGKSAHRVKRLVRVADQVENPYEVIGTHIV